VVDSGEGIAPADLSHVFDRLGRDEPSRVHAGPSTGLGLSIAHGPAEALGGTLTRRGCASAAGTGWWWRR